MSKKDYYLIIKNIEKVKRGESTNFLDPSTCLKVISNLKGYKYQIYYPYIDSEKVIIYSKNIPNIKLLEIITSNKITHNEIMGSLFGIGLTNESFGDIIIYNSHYYIMIIPQIYNQINQYLNMIGKNYITLKEVPLELIANYQRNYQELKLIIPSPRIDIIVSRLCKQSREVVKKKFAIEEVILNYEVCHKIETNLKENDILSIRKNGKYKVINITKNIKRNNYTVILNKYI